MLRNLRLLFWGRAFLETKALAAVTVLFFQTRGLRMDQIFYLTIVWSLTALVCEVPSGYLADVIGRKKTMLIGTGLFIVSQVHRVYATNYWEFAFQFVLMSAAFSCFSGTEEALLYESLKAVGREEEMLSQNGRLSSARQIFKMFTPLIGSFVASDLTDAQYRILLWADVWTAFVALGIFLFLVEPPHVKQVLEEEVGIFAESLKTIKENPWMMRVSVNKILVFTGAFFTWRVYQPILSEHGVTAIWLGVFYFLSSLFGFLGTWFLGAIEKRIGLASFMTWTAMISIVMYFVGIVSSIHILLFLSFLVIITISILREPAFSHLVNQHVQSKSRATTLSNLNMLKSVVDIPFTFLAAIVSMWDLRYPLAFGLVLCLIALIAFPIRENGKMGEPTS
ncbi:MAG: MFS transporter [Candidatus Uhrbacteria bacterium]|nr:MFS transporter [Candidatus Uhrbacteria bacterium]